MARAEALAAQQREQQREGAGPADYAAEQREEVAQREREEIMNRQELYKYYDSMRLRNLIFLHICQFFIRV